MRSVSNERAKEPAKGLKRGQVLAITGRKALEKKGAKGYKQRRIQKERAKESQRVTGRGGKASGRCCLAEGFLGCVDEVYESILVHLLPE